MPDRPADTPPGLHRRTFLAAGAGAAASLSALGSLVGAAPARAASARGATTFAIVSDTHVSPSAPDRQQWNADVYAAIAKRDPAAVLHCGDITDTGFPEEYAIHAQILPAALRGRMHYVPGNHEIRWDVSAEEEYHRHFGPAPYSFDLLGIHFIGFDPTQQLQEPGHYGDRWIDWLDGDLGRTRLPSVLFQHYPMGGDFYYVDDQDRFFDLARRHDLRGILAGHIHRDDVAEFNGLTQVAFAAVRNEPVYYWAQRSDDACTLTRVTVAPDGSEQAEPAATIPLTGRGPGADARPAVLDLGRVNAGRLPVSVTTRAEVTAVEFLLYPTDVFAGSKAGTWSPLTRSGNRWSGTAEVSALPGGPQRLRVRSSVADGRWESTAGYAIPYAAGDPKPSWQRRLDGAVQGALEVAGDTVVAVSTLGTVTALRAGSGSRIWERDLEPMYRGVAVDDSSAYVGTTAHHVHALDLDNGRVRWTYEAAAPVLSRPFVSGGAVLVSAGDSFAALDAATGKPRWERSGVGGFFAGRAAADGDRVFRGSGDGTVRAFNAATGAQLWQRQLTTGDAHNNLLYGPWDSTILLAGGLLIVATVSVTVALDPATGEQQWSRPVGCMYPPPVPIPEDPASILLTTELGQVTRTDLATGAAAWSAQLPAHTLNSGGVLHAGTFWVQTVGGHLVGIDIGGGSVISTIQATTAFSFATPVATGGTVITADQDGLLRGFRV